MLRSLNAGVSGLQQFQQKLDVIGNNIANSNTLGFKSARAEFEDNFSQSLQNGGITPMQIGSGVSMGSVRSGFQQGTLSTTGVESHLAIDGAGFFTVRNPANDESFVTRAGDFRMDSQGYLVTNNGFRLQGFSDSANTKGDIRIDDTGKPQGDTGTYNGYTIDDQGRVNVKLTSGNSFIRGQVLLQNFTDSNALIKEGNNLFSGMASAGPIGNPAPAQTNGLGVINSGHLEMSNVDLANEFATLITTQRGFQASARIVTTSDQVLEEIVNLKR